MVASTTGSDPFTFNAILGAWFRPVPFLQFGAAGQVVPASIETKSTLAVTPLDTTMGSVALTRNGLPADDVSVILPLPMTARVGARYRGLAGTREVFDVELDVEYETWSRVNEFTVDTHGLLGTFQNADVDLGKIRVAKAWRDTVAVKLGGDVAVIPAGWRCAPARSTRPPSRTRPRQRRLRGRLDVRRHVGSSLAFGRWEVAIAYQLRHQATVSVTEPDAKVYQQVPASACVSPYTAADGCNDHYVGQPRRP